MPSITRVRARLFTTGSVLVGLVASAAVVWHASHGVFSRTTSNPTNNWAAGTLTLSNDYGTAMFSVTGLKPGDTGTKCIVVTSDSTIASTVKMYGTAFSQTKAVADNLTVTVTQGASSSVSGNCAGFAADAGATNTTTASLTGFSTARTGFGNGFGTWAPAAGAGVKKTYQITWTFSNAGTQAATDAMQGGTAQIGFTWEAQAGT